MALRVYLSFARNDSCLPFDGRACVDLEERLRAAVTRVYQAAGLRLGERDVYSLARVYADWAAGCDESVVDRVERVLARSLGVRAA